MSTVLKNIKQCHFDNTTNGSVILECSKTFSRLIHVFSYCHRLVANRGICVLAAILNKANCTLQIVTHLTNTSAYIAHGMRQVLIEFKYGEGP